MRPFTSSLLVALALASPAIAQPQMPEQQQQRGITELTGKLTRVGKALHVQVGDESVQLRLTGTQWRSLDVLIGQDIVIEGEYVRGAYGVFKVSDVLSPRRQTLQGLVEKQGDALVLTNQRSIELGGISEHVEDLLSHRTIKARGWLRHNETGNDSLTVYWIEAKTTKKGWLSKKKLSDDHEWSYETVANVEAGETVRIYEFSTYNSEEKLWTPIYELDRAKGDLPFARVAVLREGRRVNGWIPVFKLEIGKAEEVPEAEVEVDAAPEQESVAIEDELESEPSTQQAKIPTEQKRGAAGILEGEQKQQAQPAQQNRVREWLNKYREYFRVGGLAAPESFVNRMRDQIGGWARRMGEGLSKAAQKAKEQQALESEGEVRAELEQQKQEQESND